MTVKTRQNYTFYVIMLAIFGVLMFWIIQKGAHYGPALPDVPSTPSTEVSALQLFGKAFLANLHHPLSLLLLQIIAILICVRIFSYLFKYLGQPGVIGEIVAGIVLGPSLLGHFFPEVYQFLFPAGSLGYLEILSQMGLVLFMFVIGMELDLGILKRKASETLVISHASIIVPFFLGMLLAYYTYPEFGAGHTSFLAFSLFIGISVSITAFPVLARIIQERNLGKTPMGMLAIASAANNDVTAWCMLAAIIAVVNAGSITSALFTIALCVVYVVFMFGLMRPLLRKLGSIYNNPEVINKTFVSFIFLVLLLSSFFTEILGIHALFGAFVAGIVMPENMHFRRILTDKVEDIALVLFLPLFFVFTGLRTEIGLLNSPHLWAVCGIFIVVSIAGKLFGASLSARFVGETWKDSLSIGILMNTRGLMELIVLNIGYEMGIIPSSLFVIFVIMALFTTFMATPCLVLIDRIFLRREAAKKSAYPKVLISFGNPESGRIFLHVLRLLSGRNLRRMKLTAVHYTIGTDTNPINIEEYSTESFALVQDEARKLGIDVDTRYKVTDHYIRDMVELARDENFDFILVGGGPGFINAYTSLSAGNSEHSRWKRITHRMSRRNWFFAGGLAGFRARALFHSLRNAVGVFVNRGFNEAEISRIGVLLTDHPEGNLTEFTANHTADVCLEIKTTGTVSDAFRQQMDTIVRKSGPNVCESTGQTLEEFIRDKQLLVISYRNWIEITRTQPEVIGQLPSFVVIRPTRK